MNKELLANIRNVLIPTLASRLKKTNYEGQGEEDAIEFTHDMTEIFDLAERQLSAKPHRWTPVSSESMPEDGVTVWVTIQGHDVITCEDGETLEQAVARISKMRRVSEGFWCEDDKTWYNAGGYPMMVQPIAWMPMEVPEPWRGQDETRGVSETP